MNLKLFYNMLSGLVVFLVRLLFVKRFYHNLSDSVSFLAICIVFWSILRRIIDFLRAAGAKKSILHRKKTIFL